jgi:hypothetical protein
VMGRLVCERCHKWRACVSEREGTVWKLWRSEDVSGRIGPRRTVEERRFSAAIKTAFRNRALAPVLGHPQDVPAHFEENWTQGLKADSLYTQATRPSKGRSSMGMSEPWGDSGRALEISWKSGALAPR